MYRYKYFISYSHTKGTGNIQIDRKKKIKSIKEVKEVQSYIEELFPSIRDVVVLNFIKF